jgi:hypothetical protein
LFFSETQKKRKNGKVLLQGLIATRATRWGCEKNAQSVAQDTFCQI